MEFIDKQIFNKLLQKSNIMLLNKPDLRFFGILSYGLKKYILTPEEYRSKIDIPSLAFTDGKTINFLLRKDVLYEEILGIIIHELLHIISHHIGRSGDRDRMLWLLCCDHVVNRVTLNLSQKYNYVKMSPGYVFFEDIHAKHPEISVEDLYDLLKKNNNISYKEQQIGDGIKIKIVKDKKNNKTYIGASDVDGSTFNESIDKIEKNCKEIEQKGRTIWESNMIEKGFLSSDISTYLDDIFKIEIPWHEVLESAIMYYLQSNIEPSWKRRNPYIRTANLPSYLDGFGTKTLIAAIDSSGSISDKNLKDFVGVLMGSANHFKSLIVLIHDVEIQDEIIFDNTFSECDIIQTFNKIKGRGGTSHKYVFDRITELVEEEEISTTVFLTDFESDVEQIYEDYNWLELIPTVWVLNKNKEVNLDNNDCKTIVINN